MRMAFITASLRDPGAEITEFDAPGAGTGNQPVTFDASVNPEGTITGYVADSNNAYHGFVRTRDGSFITFDVPDAGTGRVPPIDPQRGRGRRRLVQCIPDVFLSGLLSPGGGAWSPSR